MADFAVRGGHALRLARQTLLESRTLLYTMLLFLVHFPYFGDFSGIIADTFLDFAGLCVRSWPRFGDTWILGAMKTPLQPRLNSHCN